MTTRTDFNELSVFRLAGGSHKDASEGVCAMEAVAWLEGLPHSDRPECACPVIASYVRTLNDRLLDDDRQRLVAYLPRLVGTVDKSSEQARAEYLAWQAITVFAPIALEAFGFNAEAETLRRFDRANGLEAARVVVRAAAARTTACIAAYATVYAAADAARAATDAAYAADAADAFDAAFDALDGVLAIGKQAELLKPKIKLRAQEYRAFQLANGLSPEAARELEQMKCDRVVET